MFDRALELERRGDIDAALDLLFDVVDSKLQEGDFSGLSDLLLGLDVRDFSPDLLIGVLTITAAAKSELPSRAALVCRVRSQLKSFGMREPGLLQGLD
jgi:hypothetical protein